MNKENITVEELIEELKKLDPKLPIIFSAVSEIEYAMKKEDILDHFSYEQSFIPGEEHYCFVL